MPSVNLGLGTSDEGTWADNGGSACLAQYDEYSVVEKSSLASSTGLPGCSTAFYAAMLRSALSAPVDNLSGAANVSKFDSRYASSSGVEALPSKAPGMAPGRACR